MHLVGRAVPLCENTKVEASVKCVFKRGVVFGGTVPSHKNTQEDAPVKCVFKRCVDFGRTVPLRSGLLWESSIT